MCHEVNASLGYFCTSGYKGFNPECQYVCEAGLQPALSKLE